MIEYRYSNKIHHNGINWLIYEVFKNGKFVYMMAQSENNKKDTMHSFTKKGITDRILETKKKEEPKSQSTRPAFKFEKYLYSDIFDNQKWHIYEQFNEAGQTIFFFATLENDTRIHLFSKTEMELRDNIKKYIITKANLGQNKTR